MTEIVDARGVEIAAGDVVIYGFGVGRSVAMAEGKVLGDLRYRSDVPFSDQSRISLTASGRVRVEVVRRSWGGGGKPVVDIAPDRLVVLKRVSFDPWPTLPPSPLPTQDEANADRLRKRMEQHTDRLRSLGAGEPLTPREANYVAAHHPDEHPVGYWVSRYSRDLTNDREELKKIEMRTDD